MKSKKDFFKGATGWWEYMVGNRAAGLATLKEVYPPA